MGKQTKLNGAHKKKGSPNGSDKMHKTNNFVFNNNNNNNGKDLRNRKRQKDPPQSKDLLGRNGRTDRDADDCSNDIFPRHAEVIVFLVTLGVRLLYVSRKRNWWILHPDEVFQITEGNRGNFSLTNGAFFFIFPDEIVDFFCYKHVYFLNYLRASVKQLTFGKLLTPFRAHVRYRQVNTTKILVQKNGHNNV